MTLPGAEIMESVCACIRACMRACASWTLRHTEDTCMSGVLGGHGKTILKYCFSICFVFYREKERYVGLHTNRKLCVFDFECVLFQWPNYTVTLALWRADFSPCSSRFTYLQTVDNTFLYVLATGF